MASINVEFTAFGDPRFKALGILAGIDTFSARARTEAVWMFCVDRNKYSLKGILVDAAAEMDGFADLLVEVELADKNEDGTYRIRGTKGRVEYLEEARERQRNATEAARLKREKEKKYIDPISESDIGPEVESYLGSDVGSETQSEVGIIVGSIPQSSSTSSSASTSSSSSALEKKELKAKNAVAVAGAPPQVNVGKFIGVYVKAWQAKYGDKTRPSIAGKVQGQIKQFLQDPSMPFDRACELIQVYFQIPDPWFETKCHDFTTFRENLGKVGLALDSGEIPGKPKHKGIEAILKEQEARRGSA